MSHRLLRITSSAIKTTFATLLLSGLLRSAPAQPLQGGPPRRWPLCQLEQVLGTQQHLRTLSKLVSLGGERVLLGGPLGLRVGSRTLRCQPPGCIMRRQRYFEQREHPLDLALLIESSLSYQPLLDDIKAAGRDLLDGLARDARLLVLPLRAESVAPPRLLTGDAARQVVSQLAPSDDVEVRLFEGISAALGALKSEMPAPHGLPRRKVIVVIGSGLDTIMVPQRFARLGDQLARAEVPLFSIAMSPRNHQLPMLNLAELSFRSAGTFRWVRLEPEASARPLLIEQLRSLLDELRNTEVVTFSGPQVRELLRELPPGAEIALDCGEAVSQPRPLHRLAPLPNSNGIGRLMIVLLILGVGLIAGVGWVIRQRRTGV